VKVILELGYGCSSSLNFFSSSNTFFDVSECWVARDIVPSLFLVVRLHVPSQIYRCMFPNSFILLLMFFYSQCREFFMLVPLLFHQKI
jgi:hypothetical protein